MIFLKKIITSFICILLLVLLSSCNKEPSPENRFSEYIKLWNKQKFAEMYDYLSADAKKTITKENFVNRYTKIYKDLEIKNLDVQFTQSEEAEKPKDDSISLPFSVSMDTIAGPD